MGDSHDYTKKNISDDVLNFMSIISFFTKIWLPSLAHVNIFYNFVQMQGRQEGRMTTRIKKNKKGNVLFRQFVNAPFTNLYLLFLGSH